MTNEVANKIIMLVMSSMIFNLWLGERLSSPSLISLSSLCIFFVTNSHPLPPIWTQFKLSQQIQPPQHLVCQCMCSNSNFIVDYPLQVSKFTLFYLNSILKCWFFIYFLQFMYFVWVCTCFIVFSHTNMLNRFMIYTC